MCGLFPHVIFSHNLLSSPNFLFLYGKGGIPIQIWDTFRVVLGEPLFGPGRMAEAESYSSI